MHGGGAKQQWCCVGIDSKSANMKLTITSVLCLSLLLAHCNISMAGLKKLFKKPTKTKPDLNSKPKQPTQFNQGGYPQQSYPHQGGHSQYPGHTAGGYPAYGYPYGGGNPQQPGRPGGNPQQGYPYQGGYPQYPGHTAGGYPAGSYPAYGYPYGGGYGSYGGYPGGYINYNPNNKILSPYYGNSLAYGGYGGRGGSPFSNMVKDMGYSPSDKSKGFGRSAVAAAGGAMVGMALGYKLGRLPHLHFTNPDEEYFYNYYMYKKYGIQFSDNKDRDYKYSQHVETFSKYMASCMNRKDLLPAEREKVKHKPAVTTTRTLTTAVTSAPNSNAGSNTTETNNTAAENQNHNNKPAAAPTNATTITPVNSTTAAAVSVIVSKATSNSTTSSTPLNKTEVNPLPPASKVLRNDDDDDDTVSIVEIGYPALIKQLKIKRCTELFIVYAEKQMKTPSSGVQGLDMGLLGVITTAVLMLQSTNM